MPVISLAESKKFAALSGDYNPLHVDPLRARRLPFGGTVVPGISVVMRALDEAFGAHNGAPIARAQANFDSPIATDQAFHIQTDRDGDTLSLKVIVGGAVAQRILVELAPGALGDGLMLTSAPGETECREMDFASAAEANGTLPFAFDANLARALYPKLAAAVPAWQLSALAATTRLVGMECPGLHSVYTSLNIAFSAPDKNQPAVLAWRVAKADKRFGLLRMEMNGPGVAAKIDALVRPAPVAQPTYELVRARVPPDRFAGRRALIIGGSRGLGEVAGKIMAAGGADVVLTYARGSEDAASIAAEINAGGGKASICAFDVLTPPTARPDGVHADWVPTDLLFFASPPIAIRPGAAWDNALFDRFCAFSVAGLAATISAADTVFGAAKSPLNLYFPSTIYISEPIAGAAEYIASKGAAEAYCAWLATQRPQTQVHAPRLPRMLTDQTSSVKVGPIQQALDVLLASLR